MEPVTEPIVHRWYARPVLFVADIHRAVAFYVDRLGFVRRWHSLDGTGTVCQVDHGECEIILCQEAERRDRARLFIELTPAGLEQLVRETIERSVVTQRIKWGYDTIRIDDPDGNELLFPISE